MAADGTVDISEMKDLEKKLDQMGERILEDLNTSTGALIREVISKSAKDLAPVAEVGGGTLRQMIDTAADGYSERQGDTVEIGISSNASYSIFLEYGTGYKGDPAVPHTTKRRWYQYNRDYNPLFSEDDPRGQKWILRGPQEPQPYMRPALVGNLGNIKKLIAGGIKEVFDDD